MNKAALLASAFLISTVSTTASQIAFTVTATADTTVAGYIAGQSYTFIYTTGTCFTNNGNNQFDSGSNYWAQELGDDDAIWSSLAGTGLTGTFTDPRGPQDEVPFSSIWTYGRFPAPFLELIAANDFNLPIGVQTPDGSRSLAFVQTSLDFPTNIFAYPGVYTDPVTYFSSIAGTYAVTGSIFLSERTSSPWHEVELTATSLSISVIPEPSTYGALLGVAVLGAGMCRRRGKPSPEAVKSV